MDNEILKKKLSTFRSAKGRIIRVPPEVLLEVLRGWEGWKGTSKDFYRSIGVSQRQLASVLGKAKRMYRDGGFPAEEFKEIKVAEGTGGASSCGIEVVWEQGRVIRFCQVEQLLDFLKKAA